MLENKHYSSGSKPILEACSCIIVLLCNLIDEHGLCYVHCRDISTVFAYLLSVCLSVCPIVFFRFRNPATSFQRVLTLTAARAALVLQFKMMHASPRSCVKPCRVVSEALEARCG